MSLQSLSDKQKEFWNNANHRWNIKCGATRSGKTYLDYYVIPKRVRAVAGKDGLVVILGNTKSTLQRNIIEPLQNIWGTNFVSDIRSDNTANIFGVKAHCIGADKINQVDRLRGSSISYCYGDEVVTWNKEVFEMLKSRLDKPYSMFDGTGNPDHPKHWFKQFIDSDADIFSQSYSLDDNPFLDARVKENIKREYEGTVYYDRYVLGLWVRAEGIVFPKFANNPDAFIIKSDKVPKRFRWVDVGFDIGGNGSAYAMTFLAMGYDNVIYVLKASKKQAQDVPMEEVDKYVFDEIQAVESTYGVNINNVSTDHVDVIINTLNEKRYIFGKTYKPPLEDRPFQINMLMAQGRLKFVEGQCDDLVDELQNVVFDDKAEKAIILDDGSMQIDTVDSFVYSLADNWHYLND